MAKVKKTIDQKIDELAMAVKGGFDAMEKSNDERYKSTIERFVIIESEIKDINTKLGPFVSILGNYELRLRRLERKVGVLAM
ncbi:MAG: hypothetical protein V1704_03020 [Candidatus Vogelbacteria bacterium]